MEFDLHGAPVSINEGDAENSSGPSMGDEGGKHAPILVVDIFHRSASEYPIIADMGITCTMARYGVIAVAPLHPESGITCKSLKLYETLSSRCASLSVQAYVRTLCELQHVAYSASYRRCFSAAFDVYLEIKHRVNKQLDSLIYKDPLSALRAACPACTYQTKGETTLKYCTLTSIDGNNSVKRVLRTYKAGREEGPPDNIEVQDTRTRSSELIIERETVNELQDEVKRKAARTREDGEANGRMPSGRSDTAANDAINEGSPVDGLEEQTPCTTRWVNLASDAQKRMWGIFDETGIFIAACRHGVVFSICDMVRSGEL